MLENVSLLQGSESPSPSLAGPGEGGSKPLPTCTRHPAGDMDYYCVRSLDSSELPYSYLLFFQRPPLCPFWLISVGSVSKHEEPSLSASQATHGISR